MIGPQWNGTLISFSLYLLTSLVVVRDLLIPSFVDDISSFTSKIMPVCIGVLLLFNFLMMMLTSFTNPGIVPRFEAEGLPPGADPRSVDSITGFLVPRYLLLNGVCIRQKFCRTCRVYRPPRSNHCTVCDNCVLRHDHHCLALGTCVGLGNYRWFLLLCGGMCVLLPLVFWVARAKLFAIYYQDPSSPPQTLEFMKEQCVLLIVAVLSVVVSGAFLLLFIYHYFITSHNLTTNEHLKKYYKVNPFDFGQSVNFKHVLCFPQELLPVEETLDVRASYKELASTNSECVSDFYDY